MPFFSRKLIMYLCATNGVLAAVYIWVAVHSIVSDGTPSAMCLIHTYLVQFLGLASCLWTACFAMNL